MCYGRGNCDGGCEKPHEHRCPVCGERFDCVAVDCVVPKPCERHANCHPCPWCGEWHEQTRWHGYCSMTCLEEVASEDSRLEAADVAAMDADAANKDEKESDNG